MSDQEYEWSLEDHLRRLHRGQAALALCLTLLFIGMAGMCGGLYVAYQGATEQRTQLHNQLCDLSRAVVDEPPPDGC